jgi:PIN domain nuclease of toxin-antitoxin system
MRLLLDTHIFLWHIGGDERVTRPLHVAIRDAQAVYLSVASVWEASIKYQLGKLRLPQEPHPWLAQQRQRHGIESLLIDEAAIAHLANLSSIIAIRSIGSSSARRWSISSRS